MGRKAGNSDLNYAATREDLIRSGVYALTEKGFSNSGIDEILRRVGVPKGSFNYYFRNKEDFGLEILKRYDERFSSRLEFYFCDDERPSKEGLIAFMEDAKENLVKHDYRRGCIVGNLGQELNTLPKTLSGEVARVFKNWQNRLARCLERARLLGEISEDSDCQRLAVVFWCGWEGAVLKARLERKVDPLNDFGDFFVKSVFVK